MSRPLLTSGPAVGLWPGDVGFPADGLVQFIDDLSVVHRTTFAVTEAGRLVSVACECGYTHQVVQIVGAVSKPIHNSPMCPACLERMEPIEATLVPMNNPDGGGHEEA